MLEEIVYPHRDKVTRILFLEIRVVEHSLEMVVCPDTLSNRYLPYWKVILAKTH